MKENSDSVSSSKKQLDVPPAPPAAAEPKTEAAEKETSSIPAGYEEIGRTDFKDQRLMLWINIIGSIPPAAGFLWYIIYFFKNDLPYAQFNRDFFWYCLIYVVYIVLHELTHGIVYSLATRRKLCFGFNGMIAWCGVPNVYVNRATALTALLAPFVVFDIVFGILCYHPIVAWMQPVFVLLLLTHIGGCIGDLYDTWLILFDYRQKGLLMKDDGPTQIFYAPIEEEKH
ncbi:DUF3267 domain-containing protein [Allobaculum fili]|uniref:DUF3267 domain-containing protein n=2 Tax=Allobaculum TaxID=174708 RepID=UPI001E63A1D8|nr:DUF3267 domain-containing protein [Allobaculum fili]